MGKRLGNLYLLDLTSFSIHNQDVSVSCNCISFSKNILWHYRLSYPSHERIHTLKNELEIFHCSNEPVHCSVFHLAKHRRLPFVSNNSLYDTPFQSIHYDIWGSFHTITTEGYKYFLTIVDDCTHFTWIYLLHSKSDVTIVILEFFSLIQTQFGVKIKSVWSYNAMN